MKKVLFLIILLLSTSICFCKTLDDNKNTYFNFPSLMILARERKLSTIEPILLKFNWYESSRSGDTTVTYVYRKNEYKNISDVFLPNMMILGYKSDTLTSITFCTDNSTFLKETISLMPSFGFECIEPNTKFAKKVGTNSYFRTFLFMSSKQNSDNFVFILDEEYNDISPKYVSSIMIFW